MRWLAVAAGVALGCGGLGCAAQAVPDAAKSAEAAKPNGQVLFESHGDAPEEDAGHDGRRTPMSGEPAYVGPAITDGDRAAVRIESYDLEAHAVPATADLEMRARTVIRNVGPTAMERLPLEVSSALHWQSATLLDRDGAHRLVIARETVETDLDHTGAANELVLTLPRPLLADATLTLEVFYGGALKASGERLMRIGADAMQASNTDWDAVGESGIALRGIGNVLWYPVAAPPVFLGEGARLFDAVGAAKLRGQTQRARLRLSVTFADEAPVGAVFLGDQRPMVVAADDDVATVEFPERTVGFRALNLFTVAAKEVALPMGLDSAAGASSSSANALLGGAVAAVSTERNAAVLPRLSDAIATAAVSLEDVFGPRAARPLLIVDHPGQPFEDDALLVAPIEALASSDAATSLAHSLTHAWVATGEPWVDEGLAQYMALVAVERSRGREAAVAEMGKLLEPLALAEPGSADAVGQPLISARDEMFFRRKAAAVWWMLHDIAGDTAWRAAVNGMRAKPLDGASPQEQALALESALETAGHMDLKWFFADWVLADTGLPDLTIVDVTPRPLPAGPGHDAGWLVAVTVRNDGRCAAEVPLVLRSGTSSTRRHLRVAGLSTVTERVVLQTAPTELVLNDGTVPELRTSRHVRTLNVSSQ